MRENENCRRRILFPAKSSDLNPIENVWHWLKDRIREDQPEDIDELKKSIRSHWRKLKDYEFRNRFLNMGARLQECLDRNGDKTHY